MAFMHTLNTRVVGRTIEQFWIDLSARPKHAGEWRAIGTFDEEGKLVLAALERPEHPVGSALTDEQIDRILHRTLHQPGEDVPYWREWLRDIGRPCARAVLAATPSRAPAAVQDGDLPGMWEQADLTGGESDCTPKAAPAAVSEPSTSTRLKAALQTIADWALPATRDFYASGNPVSYEANYGSNGAREYMRTIAREALAVLPAHPPVTCPHADEPRGCFRVRCQLGKKCVGDDL